MRRHTVVATFVTALFPGLALGQVPAGPEFQVNVYTSGPQSIPRISSDAAGNFVVTWFGYAQDGSSHGAFARRYDATGAPIEAAEFQLNTFTPGLQAWPAAAMTPDGRVFFAWHSDVQDGDGFGIYGRLFDAAGSPTGGEFRVNSYTTYPQMAPSVTVDGSGNVIVTWNSLGQDGSEGGLFGQRYDSAGAAQGPEFQVNSYTTEQQLSIMKAVAASANGSFVVVWDGYDDRDGSGAGIFAQRYDAAGVAVGSQFQVNVYTTGLQSRPSVASDPAGNFVVVWHGIEQPGGEWHDIMGRRYDASGVAQGGEFMVNTNTARNQLYASVAMDARGGFVVAWEGSGQYDNDDVFARAFDSSGPLGPEFRVGAYTGAQHAPSVASNAAGDFVVAWMGRVNSWAEDIFARRYLSDLIFEDDFES